MVGLPARRSEESSPCAFVRAVEFAAEASASVFSLLPLDCCYRHRHPAAWKKCCLKGTASWRSPHYRWCCNLSCRDLYSRAESHCLSQPRRPPCHPSWVRERNSPTRAQTLSVHSRDLFRGTEHVQLGRTLRLIHRRMASTSTSLIKIDPGRAFALS